ncbi:MAG: hypothetical protein L3J88_12010, partial [Gammaproteobacteria bacterium]|nr:hypothetical protein [Gammaproteobacteria bacterium]MCF6364044.1 hypothetical protein [Gammaproteobacteria bacterium]
RKLNGIILKSVETIKQLIETTTTKSGLIVKCNIIRKTYKTGKKMSKEERNRLTTIHDDYLGHWNYKAIPGNSQDVKVI